MQLLQQLVAIQQCGGILGRSLFQARQQLLLRVARFDFGEIGCGA